LRRESQQMRSADHAANGICANFASASNIFEWDAYIQGPEGSLFEHGVFHCRLSFPQDYPLSPPTMRFVSPKLFHPNIYSSGLVCISILHKPGEDPLSYEQTNERWTPAQSVEKILLSVVSLLAEPNLESPANVDAAKMYRDNIEEFRRRARAIVDRSLDISPNNE